jgi:hypothetical protein
MEQSKRSEYIQIVFLILLLLGIGALVFASIQIIKYRDMLSNPLGYNLERFSLAYCTCYDKDMKLVPIKGISYNESFDIFLPKIEWKENIFNPIIIVNNATN